jgi:enoyl-CoA hydratase/carnithine racemase
MNRDYETLKIDAFDDHIVMITMNRPAVRNAMNARMAEEMRDCLAQFENEPFLARCLILTGAGDRSFCSGADLKERQGISDALWLQWHQKVQQMVRAAMSCPIPIIAAVNGPAFGGGCEIALGCDFIYASENARFALTEVSLGIIPGAAGTQYLPRAVGQRRAKEFILTAAACTAAEALEWGMVNRVCAQDRLIDEVFKVARRITANAPISARQAKKAIDRGMELTLANGVVFEAEAYYRTVLTEDRREGVLAFNEKRKPIYKGA